jgi:hypothetical protein
MVMTRVTIDNPLIQQLKATPGPVELCDSTGRVVGQFFLRPDPAEYEGLEPPFSEEELKRRRHLNQKRYTTEEVIAFLEKLP